MWPPTPGHKEAAVLTWMLTQASPDVIRFTVTPVSSKIVTLRDFTAPFAATVDWGDGVTDRIAADSPVSHTYADATARQVVIRGRLGGFWNMAARPAGVALITSLDEISSRSLISLTETFRECTALAAVPEIITAPNLTACDRTFYLCKSIAGDLPALWLTHAAAAHENCFSQCFLSLFGQYDTACPHRQYVAAVEAQTYYQKYGTGCSAAKLSTGSTTIHFNYYNKYGSKCPQKKSVTFQGPYYKYYGLKCPQRFEDDFSVARCRLRPLVNAATGYYTCEGSNCVQRLSTTAMVCQFVYGQTTDPFSKRLCVGSLCTQRGTKQIQYSYYACTQSAASGVSECSSSCKRVYTSDQSAYYKCTRSGVTCQTDNCPYPYANEVSVNAARAAGWAI